MDTTLTSKGQITIPVVLRNKLGLKTGDKVLFVEDSAGNIIMRPKTRSIRDLIQTLPRPTHKASLADIETAIIEGSSAPHDRP